MNYFQSSMDILSHALSSIQEEEFSHLLALSLSTIQGKGKIMVSGLGKNVAICEKFVGTLHSLGISSAFMHTNSAVHGDLGMVKQEDLVIILSKSGETTESVYLADLLAQKKCDIFLLSFSRQSTLYEKIPHHLVIDLEHEGDQWNILPNHSTTLNLIVLQELAMRLLEKLDIPLDVLKENHPGGAIGARLQK